MSGADKPASISKFLPSKVISPGINLYRKSQKRMISTKILIICNCVRISGERLSINLRPLFETNKISITINEGAIIIANLGGIVFVTV